jgi:ParB/RepB/Spo0J family partition protein
VAQVEEQTVQQIPISRIDVHKLNPRADVGDIEGLAASMKEEGLYQPILVVRDNGGWALIDGKRRLAAARLLGLSTISAIEREMTNSEIAFAALVTNLQRKDLDPLEEARAYRAWMQATDGGSQADLARLLGKDHSTISNALRLLDAPKPIADALREKRITPAHARVALELKNPGDSSALPLKPGVTVDELQDSVTRHNEAYETKGEGARQVLRKALADAKAKYPNATITWQAGGAYGSVVSLTATLGRPPAKIVAGLSSYAQVTAMAHDKACTCRAYKLNARSAYSGTVKLVTELERVCIDAKGYAAAKPKARKVTTPKTKAAKKPKPPTPEQLAKKTAAARKTAERAVTKHLVAPKSYSLKGAPIFAKLKSGTIPADVARAIAYVDIVSEGYFGMGVTNDLAGQIAWERIAKMPAKKVSALAAASVAKRLEDEVVNTRLWVRAGEEPPVTPRLVAAYFGVKVAEPKAAKKKAKR